LDFRQAVIVSNVGGKLPQFPFSVTADASYPEHIMPTRDDLKALIDQMPPEKLDLVRMNLESLLHPPAPNAKVEKAIKRSEEFTKQLPERLKQLQAGCKPETIRGFSGGGAFGNGPGFRGGQGHVAYSWWEDITHVTHRFVLHAGRELDIVERLQLTEDETKLIHELELYAEGRVVKRKEEFPVTTAHSS
jgi:hypothetical protein